MWIKTEGRGALVNTNSLDWIDYDERHDVTKGYNGVDECYTIAKGNVVAQIFANQRMGKPTMEVE